MRNKQGFKITIYTKIINHNWKLDKKEKGLLLDDTHDWDPRTLINLPNHILARG